MFYNTIKYTYNFGNTFPGVSFNKNCVLLFCHFINIIQVYKRGFLFVDENIEVVSKRAETS